MAQFQIELKSGGIDRLLGAIGNKGGWAKILRALAATIGFRDIINHFKEEKGPEKKWKQRSAATQIDYWRIRTGKMSDEEFKESYPNSQRGWFSESNKLLVLSGTLRQGFLPSNIRMTSDSATLFNSVSYSGKHDRGEDGLPERPFMWLSESAMEKIEKGFLQHWVGEGLA